MEEKWLCGHLAMFMILKVWVLDPKLSNSDKRNTHTLTGACFPTMLDLQEKKINKK